MNTLRAIWSECFGLFVDDGALALALVLCCAVVGAAVALAGFPAIITGPALLAGCAGILLGNVRRAARR